MAKCKSCTLKAALEILLTGLDDEDLKNIYREKVDRCEMTLHDVAKEVGADDKLIEILNKVVDIDKTICEL